MEIADFFKMVRASCSAVTWSRGVELSRDGGVLAERVGPTEAVLRVSTPARPASATVTLLFEDEDWLCDCRSSTNPCEHVAAAVIALKRAKEQGKVLPISSVERGVVIYAFFERDGSLYFERRIRAADSETVMTQGLAAQTSGKSDGPLLSATNLDWTVDSLLRDQKPNPLTSATMSELLSQLKRTAQVTLNGESIEVGGSPISPLSATLNDAERGVRLQFRRHPDILKTFKNGAALCTDGLRPLLQIQWAPEEATTLREGRTFEPSEYASLVSDLLPKLREKVRVEVQSHRLPQIDQELRPRLIFQTAASGEVLSVLPLIVYGNPPLARVDGGRLVFLGEPARVPFRQTVAEKNLATALHSEWGLSVGRRIEYRGEAADRFSEQLENSRYEVIGRTREHFGVKPPLATAISFEDGRLKIGFSAGGGGEADPSRVFQAWREGFSRVPLIEGGWAPVPTDWLEQYGHRVLALLESKDARGEIAAFHRPEAARLCDHLGIDCPPDFSRLRKQLETFQGISPAPISADLRSMLRPYQQRGVDWLNFLRESQLGALLADDMGLGKSVQTIAVLSGRTLIVSPTSVMTNWQKELTRFRPALSVCVFHGSGRSLDPNAQVVLTTYALLRLDRERLSEIEWDSVVLDEAQYIKNSDSQSAQAAFGLRAKFRIALTGTPIENRPEDLWSIFHFLNPGFLGTRDSFQNAYWANDAGRVEDLREKIKPFILRRLKREVAPELPPRTETVLYSDLSREEQVTYDTVKAATQKSVLQELGKNGNVMAALESLLRLRQAACHSALLPGGIDRGSSKVNLLVEKLDEVVGEQHKALVFSQWTSLLDLIEPELEKAGITFSRIDGSTGDRQSVIDRFQSPRGPSVLLMTLKAGGVGLNLTAADHVFLVDPWWNPAAEDQAADRAHRIGQTRPVFVHRLVSRGTVEEKILALQESKRATAEHVLSGADRATAITREDLMELLR